MSRPIPLAGIVHPDPKQSSPWVVLGIADDSQSTYMHGPSEAPARIREAYDGRCFNSTTETGVELAHAVVDRGDLKPLQTWHSSAELYTRTIETICYAGQTPFVIGGDHAVTVPVLAGFASIATPIHVIQIDAHPDLYADFEGNPDSHACTAARLLEMAHVESVTQLGVRTLNSEQQLQVDHYADRLHILEARQLTGAVPRLGHIPDGAAVYLTIDMDGFDPSIAPGVSHPVPGGLHSRQILQLIQQGHWTLVGMDVVEVNPLRDVNDQTSILAGRLLHEALGYAAGGGRPKA